MTSPRCRTVDPGLFFPIQGHDGGYHGPASRQAASAIAVCRQCPLTAECLNRALAEGLDHGIYGATTPQQRRALRRPGLLARALRRARRSARATA